MSAVFSSKLGVVVVWQLVKENELTLWMDLVEEQVLHSFQ